MRRVAALCLAMCCVVLAATPTAKPEYFKYSRKVNLSRNDAQNYFVVDRAMWENMRGDLGDMRLFSQTDEVPYALVIQRGGRSQLQDPAKLLDLGESGSSTEFKLQTLASEYDTITLNLKTKNFNTTAVVEGSDNANDWRKIATATIFDFSDEKLGRNFDIRLPAPARFSFLRVTLRDHVPAKDVEGATVATLKDQRAAWMTLPAEPRRTERERDTVFEWDSPKIPLERVQLSVENPALNFYRSAELQDADGHVIGTTELSRVHMRRDHTQLDHENLSIDVPSTSTSKHYKLVIHNGDDRALPALTVLPLSYERRVYFQPQGRTDFTLYFGDEKAEAPVYDYARLFREDPAAQRAALEPGVPNLAYKGRPDDRPWTERNQWVLWSALIIAVVGLGTVALRGLKSAT